MALSTPTLFHPTCKVNGTTQTLLPFSISIMRKQKAAAPNDIIQVR
jgi:hypothetical protein